MALDWVQRVLQEKVGFTPYAGTLNLRIAPDREIARWKDLRKSMKGVNIAPSDSSFCHARCFLARIDRIPAEGLGGVRVAVLVPEVDNYPADKVEVIAPFHVKGSLHVRDGDRLTLEFIGE